MLQLCGKFRHYSRECPYKGKGKGKPKGADGTSFGKSKGKTSMASLPLTRERAKAILKAKARAPQMVVLPAEEPTMPANVLKQPRAGLKGKPYEACATCEKSSSQ